MRALLLTDVVDSTRLSEALGDQAMSELWAAHDLVARELLVEHGGLEIDKTDGFLLLFENVGAAAAYAAAYHDAMADLQPPLSSRAGLHYCPVILRENPADAVARGAKPLEVDGVGKAMAARVMSLAPAGRTLATAEAVDALGWTRVDAGRLGKASGSVAVSHGHWQLKGVSEPQELFEIGTADQDFLPPQDAAKVWRVVHRAGGWVPAREVPHQLPQERDAFVGREADLKAVAAAIDEGARLVSVLGVGGTGKTRLATRYAWSWLGQWPGGAWFCDLSEARSEVGILTAVASGLSLKLGVDPPAVQIGNALRGRGRCLLILDNAEQVARELRPLLEKWLDGAPDTQVLVTSREVLGIAGERALALSPLTRDEAITLFATRAHQADRNYRSDPAEAKLVDLLDCLPLAIELAAARVRSMSVPRILERMDQRFRLLATTGRRDRQATLRATLDWSWDLLEPDEQTALAQLSVFEGGFDLELANAVLELEDGWVDDVVGSLVDKSLVYRSGEDRLDLLVSVQAYGREKLEDAGPVEARHFRAMADLYAPRSGRGLRSSPWTNRANLEAGWRRALAAGQPAEAARVALVLGRIVKVEGPLDRVLELAEPLRCDERVEEVLRIRLEQMRGEVWHAQGRIRESHEIALALVDRARGCGDRRLLADILRQVIQTGADGDQPRVEAEDMFREARALLDGPEDRARLSILLRIRAYALTRTGRGEEAIEAANQAIELGRAADSPECVVQGLEGRAGAEADLGRLHDAAATLEEAVRISENQSHPGEILDLRARLGRVRAQQYEVGKAIPLLEQALPKLRAIGSQLAADTTLANLTLCMDLIGDIDRARAGYAELLANPNRPEVSRAIQVGNLGRMLLRIGAREEAVPLLHKALSCHRERDFAYGQPYWLGALARHAADEGDADAARVLIAEAVEMAEPFHLVLRSALLDVARAHIRMGDLAAAREALERSDGTTDTGRSAVGAAVWAWLAHLEGDEGAVERYLAEARANAYLSGPGTEVAAVLAELGPAQAPGAQPDATRQKR